MGKNQDKEQVIEGLIGWMENLEEASLEELREIRNELGHNTEKDEAEFLEILRRSYQELDIPLKEDSSSVESDAPSDIKPYLGYVSDETDLPPSKIEQEMGFPTEFFIQITENPEAVEEGVREEIANRTLIKFPQLNRNKVLLSLKQQSRNIAAARATAYSNEIITFEKILDSSGMSKEEREFWLHLNRRET
jgi:hypothetical protein